MRPAEHLICLAGCDIRLEAISAFSGQPGSVPGSAMLGMQLAALAEQPLARLEAGFSHSCQAGAPNQGASYGAASAAGCVLQPRLLRASSSTTLCAGPGN